MRPLVRVAKYLVAFTAAALMAAYAAPSAAAPQKQAAPAAKPAANERTVELKVTADGFVPSPVTVKKGEPLKLVVTRTTDDTCATELVLDEAKVHVALPLNQPVEVRFTPSKAGKLVYGCGMDKMVSGELVVQ